MASRFILILTLGKILNPNDLGIFGLLVAAIGFSILFVGFDYYTYSNRELLSSDKSQWSKIIINQIYAYIPLYILFVPIAYILYSQDLLPKGYFSWFAILMLLEHVSTEQNRLLNTMQKQLSATVVLFFRTGLWSLAVVPLMVYSENLRSLDTILYGWTLGVTMSIAYGTYIIKKSILSWSSFEISTEWILRGYKVGFLFLLGTLSFQAINTGDKFILHQLSNESTVGVYIFYTSLVVGASAFIHAGIIVFSTPNIITSYQKNDFVTFNILMNKFIKELLVSVAAMSALLYLFMPFVVDWVGKREYIEYYNIFYIILFATIATILGSHPGTYLYASKRDKYIFLSNILAIVIFATVNLLFYIDSSFGPLFGVSMSLLISFWCLLIIKYAGYFYYHRSIA